MLAATRASDTNLSPVERASEVRPKGRARRRPRILCVDDEPAMLSVLVRALGADYTLTPVGDPFEALELLARDKGYSVVISDMKMPLMDGAEFLERARHLAPHATRLAMTACLESEVPPENAFGVLTKPCPLRVLQESISLAVLQHALRTGKPWQPAPAPDATPDEPVAGSDPTAPVPALAQARLALRLFGKDITLRPGPTLVGRSRSCDVVIDDPRIALRHARFVSSWRGVTLTDVSGKDTVVVNGKRLGSGSRYLEAGDRIHFGPYGAEIRELR